MASNVILAKLLIQIAGDTSKFGASLQQGQNQLGSFLKSVKSAAGAIGVAFGAVQVFNGIKAAVGIMADFEHTMSEVKAITGATGSEFKALEEDALRLGRSTKFTATQVGQLQVAYGRLGFTTREILAATAATLDLAAATGEDLAKSADVAGSTVRGFGLDASETQRVVDVMASSFNKTALGLDNFTESMKYVAPIAAAAGASVEETTALLGVLADAGIRGSTAGTSLRKIFTDLSKDGRPLKERLAELAAKGITLGDAFDEVGRTAQTSLLVITKNTEKAKELTSAFSDVAGEASAMARIMGDDLEGDVKRLTSAWEGLILKVGNSDPWRKAVQDITGVINALTGTKDIQDNLNILARLISEGLGKRGLHELEQIITEAKAAREELGKPIDVRQVEELAQKYKLTSQQANTLFQAILEINKSLSFQETALKQFNDFAQRNGYTDLTDAAEKYKQELYELILAQQVQKQDLQKLSAVAGDGAFLDNIKRTDEQIAAYRRVIGIINEYVTTLERQKKKENEVAKAQILNLDLYQELLKKKNEEYEKASATQTKEDQERLRLLAAEIAALQTKIDKLNAIKKLAQIDQVALPSTNNTQFGRSIDTGKLTDQVTLKFDPLKNFFTQFQDAIQKLRDSLTGLKEHVVSIDLGGLIGGAVSDMAFALGQAAVGVGNFGTAILKAVIGFAKQLGEILIASGIAIIAAKKLLTNPYTAIAAGIALVAIAGAASAALSRSQQNFNSGGGGSSDGRTTTSTADVGSRAATIKLEVVPFKFDGKDMWLMLKNYEAGRKYTHG